MIQRGVLFLTLVLVGVSGEDLYASLTQIEEVYHLEGKFLEQLESLVKHFDSNMKQMKAKISDFKLRRRDVKEVDTYLENPINSFLFIKSTSESMQEIKTLFFDPIEEILENIGEMELSEWPKEQDVEGAASALIRLQTTYKLNIDQLMQGRIRDHKTTPLTPRACFIIGETAFKQKDNEMTHQWMSKALELCGQNCEPNLKINITEFLAYSEFEKGNLNKAIQTLRTLLGVDNKHQRAISNLQFLLHEFMKLPAAERTNKFMEDPYGKTDQTMHYHYACQGYRFPPKEVVAKLRCHLVHHNNPYLKIGPVKEEEVYLDPRVVVYKDIIFDSEIEELKVLSKTQMVRSSVQSGVSEKIRVSKVAWMDEHSGNIVKVLLQRFSAYANLTWETAEALQLVNYGLGGHYLVHYDAFSEEETRRVWNTIGNRIATLLIYMNDVEEGGHTVFPELGLSVKPEKGAAALWYNLDGNGTLDERTLHAACPVIIGKKWAANLWFHEAGHEFTRPCPPQIQ